MSNTDIGSPAMEGLHRYFDTLDTLMTQVTQAEDRLTEYVERTFGSITRMDVHASLYRNMTREEIAPYLSIIMLRPDRFTLEYLTEEGYWESTDSVLGIVDAFLTPEYVTFQITTDPA